MIVVADKLVPPGRLVLWRQGKPVWCGDIDSPIEDAEFDKITVSPVDYQRMKDALRIVDERR